MHICPPQNMAVFNVHLIFPFFVKTSLGGHFVKIELKLTYLRDVLFSWMLFSSQAHVVSQYPWSGINHLFTTRFNHFVLCFYGRQSTCFRFLLFLAFSIANEISWFTPLRDRTSEFFKLLITTRHYLWQKWKCKNYRRTGPSWLESNIYQRRLLCSSITLLNYANDKYWTIFYQNSYQILNK